MKLVISPGSLGKGHLVKVKGCPISCKIELQGDCLYKTVLLVLIILIVASFIALITVTAVTQ